jgi:RNA-directed DNA polymerase
MIPKPGGGERPLGIPTIRDRVVQTAAKLVLEPIFEADLDPAAYGYRPRRGAGQAIQTVLTLLRQGYTDVVDADLSKYFDTIPHDELMQSLARRIVDPDMLRLIKQWLKAPVETTDGDGKRRMEGGKASRQGVPQGGVISPLIANLYMNRFLKYWRQTGRGEAWRAHVINYADDFVILSRGHAAEALAWTDRTMTRLGLSLNRTKTRLCEARTERFDFLGRASTRARVQLRSAPHPPGRTPLHRRQSIGQERAASEGKGECHPGTGQYGTMGGRVRATDPLDAGRGWPKVPSGYA